MKMALIPIAIIFCKIKEYLLIQKTFDQKLKDLINILQNNNFIETMKHINSYRVENIPGMNLELLTTISLLNLQGMKKKARVEYSSFLLSKVCSTKPL